MAGHENAPLELDMRIDTGLGLRMRGGEGLRLVPQCRHTPIHELWYDPGEEEMQ